MLLRLKYLASLLVIALLTAPNFAHAADAPKLKPPVTAVIDIQRILKDSTAAQSVRTQLEDRQRSLRDEFAKIEADLHNAEQELQRQRSVLSADAFEEKRLDFERRVGEANRKADTAKTQLNNAFQEALKQIQTAMLGVAEGVAQQMELDLVLPRSQVIFVSQDLDITEPVLKGLNAKLPTVKLTEGKTPAEQPEGGASGLGTGAPAKGTKPAANAPAPAPAPATGAAPASKQ